MPLVLAHELGHFIARAGRACASTSSASASRPGPAILHRGKETVYTLNWLPIGGFVRLEGEEGESLDPRAFVNQRLRTRLVILLAGVIVNFLLAWLIFTLIALLAEPVWQVRMNEVVTDSPAERAGLVASRVIGQTEPIEVLDAQGEPTGEIRTFPIYDDAGDLIVAIDGQRFPVFDDLASSPPTAVPARCATCGACRGDGGPHHRARRRHARGRRRSPCGPPRRWREGLGALGFLPGSEYGMRTNGLRRIDGHRPPAHGGGVHAHPARGRRPGRGHLQGPGAELPVAGPIGMVSLVGGVRESAPPVFLFWLIGLLSANLAVINILPFPPMDGGRIAMALVQAASRNRVSPATERLVYLTGFVMLMALLVIVTWSDIQRLAS